MSVCEAIFDGTKLQIEPDICSSANKLLSEKRKPDEEIEVRFGYTIQGKYFNGIAIDSREARNRWYRLLRILKDSELYQPQVLEKTLVESFGKVRKILDLSKVSPPLLQEKILLKSIDVFNFQIDDIVHTIRLNSANERVRKDLNLSGKPDSSRLRTRVSFTAKDGSHRFDLTYVSTSPQNATVEGFYEVEIEYLSVMSLPSFFKPIKLVVHCIKGSSALITTTDREVAINGFNKFFSGEGKFDPTRIYRKALPQPINLKRKHLSSLVAYSATNKLNGTRMVGVWIPEGFYLIDMANHVIKVNSGDPQLNGSVIDVEYFKNEIHAFDILFYKGKDLRGLNLDVRLNRLYEIEKDFLTVKPFMMSGNIQNDTKEIFKIIDALPEEDNDGIIYTPITESYFNNHIYKWKPPKMLTIDFTAVPIGEGKYNLKVVNKGNKLEIFKPDGFSGIIESEKELKGVGEYEWDFKKKTFVLSRNRPDKELPNFISVALDVWDDIQHPLEREELLASLGDIEKKTVRDAVRQFNNSIKRDLISSYLENKVVVDLGAGKGGDLSKYQSARIRGLYLVEPNTGYLKELRERVSKLIQHDDFTKRITIIQAFAEETQKILGEVRRKVDAVSMFFSLSFFFENQLLLSRLVDTISELIDKEGLFIGTTIDGRKTSALFKEKGDNVNLNSVSIRKIYSGEIKEGGTIGFNRQIGFKYSGSETVASEQIEYLVDWDLFVAEMRRRGFILLNTKMFEQPSYMNEDEKKFTSLYRSFVFKRTSMGVKDLEEKGGGKEEKVKPVHLKMLEPGKTAKIKTVFGELVRTGTVGDGNCFFNACTTATNPEFRKMNKGEQKALIKDLRKSLKISEERWLVLGKGQVARLGLKSFDTVFHDALFNSSEIYKGTNKELFDSFGGSTKPIEILLSTLNKAKYQNMNLPRFINEIKEAFREKITQFKPDMLEAGMANLERVIETSKRTAYQNFLDLTTTCGKWVGQEVLELVGDHINRDIYILDDTTGDAYKTECIQVKGRVSIIILFQGGNHYECIGRLLEDNKVEREFPSDDKLIQEIKKKVC